MKKCCVLANAAVVIMFFTYICSAGAQEQAQDESRVASGEVSAINSSGIAVVYDRNYDTGAEYEIYFPVDKTTPIKHKGSLKEIKVGDLVSVDYIKTKEGKTIAKSVTFIQAAIPSDALVSEPVVPIPDASEPVAQDEGEAQ